MPRFHHRSVILSGTLGVLLLASCAAPISYVLVPSKTPAGDFAVSPLSDALHELEAGKAEKDPSVAAGHFFDSARLASDKALLGESGALALYNHSVARLIESLQDADSLPWGRTISIRSGGSKRTLRGKPEPGAPVEPREFRIVDNLNFRGKFSETRANREGVGAPLVAIVRQNHNYRRKFESPQNFINLTALLRFDGTRSATLELHDPLDLDRISITRRNPPLAANFSAAASLGMADLRPDKLGLIRLLNPQKYSDTARLVRLQKYDPDRIPVLFVHGLQDTPASWAPMYFSLLNDPEIRKRFQFWAFSYPSGYPYPYSASLLRKELDGINRRFPGHKDILIIGHSMGGMISRLMVTDAGDTIWRGYFGKSPSEFKITGSSRQLLQDSLVFRNRPEIHRAIFISAPHKGSEIASNWIGRIASRLINTPNFIADARDSFASVITADAASLQLERAPNSIDTLAPNNRFVKAVANLPIAPGVTYHSIIGDRGKGDTPNSSDGVVPYWSSHMAGAASEKIVPSDHSAYHDPAAIEEVRRILKLELKSSNPSK